MLAKQVVKRFSQQFLHGGVAVKGELLVQLLGNDWRKWPATLLVPSRPDWGAGRLVGAGAADGIEAGAATCPSASLNVSPFVLPLLTHISTV